MNEMKKAPCKVQAYVDFMHMFIYKKVQPHFQR